MRRKNAVANVQRSAYCSTVSGEKTAQRQTTSNIQCPMSTCQRQPLPRASSPPAIEAPVELFPESRQCFRTLYTLRIVAINVSIYVHVPRPRGGPQTRRTRCVTHQFDLPPLISQPHIVDDHQNDRRNDPVTTSNQPLQGESNFGDSSGPLFSIYTKAAEDEDKKLVERWQKDADGILIFVSPRVVIRLSLVFFTYRPGIP